MDFEQSQRFISVLAGDMKAAPESAHTIGVTLLNQESEPSETGGVVIYDDNVERPSLCKDLQLDKHL